MFGLDGGTPTLVAIRDNLEQVFEGQPLKKNVAVQKAALNGGGVVDGGLGSPTEEPCWLLLHCDGIMIAK